VRAASVTQIASLFTGHWNRNYVATKLRTDPLYTALAENLRGSDLPLLDLGCGLGLLALFLRAEGFTIPIHGLDYDSRKIETATQVIAQSGTRGVSFDHCDVRAGLLPEHQGDVSILDILQFFTPTEQEKLLALAASRVAPGGKLIIRSGLRDSSWRFKITVLGDLLAKLTFWMKAAPTHYPSGSDFQRILSPFGAVSVTPLWGNTPFNNYLIVLIRST
jgi:2-polyprenyl-3-methyl-5-hydroxy-6-metoxy-1,4-benzoquinol methylase